MSRMTLGSAFLAVLLGLSAPALADDAQSEIQSLKAELQSQKDNMARMQARLDQLEQQQTTAAAAPVSAAQSNDNAFNPAISVVMNGHYAAFSGKSPEVKGFSLGEEGGRVSKGLSLDESEIGISSNVDDKFAAQVTASLAEADGQTEIELEEAYVRSIGLPHGLGVKVGRFLEPIGYLNEHHAHTDDFADRPLPNRAFLGGAWKDDGALASWILPTDFYSEVGAGLVRGNDFPGGGLDGSHAGAWLAYGRVGGDIGENQNWLLGVSTSQSSPTDREGNDSTVKFSGDSDLYAASLRYVWAPTGNAMEKELSLQGEYFWRGENGTYEDTVAATGAVPYDGNQSGWYAQGVYKFAPQWRIGTRYSVLYPGSAPAGLAGSALDAAGHDPWNAALMADWTNSEFSRIRLQYGHESPATGKHDNQIMLQYIVAIGAHPAHTF